MAEGDGKDTPPPKKVELIPLQPKKIIKERGKPQPATPRPPQPPPEKRG
jgi:hypothetical protein